MQTPVKRQRLEIAAPPKEVHECAERIRFQLACSTRALPVPQKYTEIVFVAGGASGGAAWCVH